MRFSSTALLALPLLAAAAEGPFEQYKAQFQNFLGSFGAAPSKPEPEAANPDAPSPADDVKTATFAEVKDLTLSNWKDTLYSPVKAEATTPEEWWVLVTGGNKTCYGHCIKVEAAFTEAASKLADLPDGPHTAMLNCDEQPVLCNAWSAGTGTLWVFEMLPPPAPIDIYRKRLNLTTTTPETILDLYAQDSKKNFLLHEGYFHPFDGPLAEYGVAIPLGYFFWVFNAIPSWAMMLIISFFSRRMMSRRMENPGNAPRNAAPAQPRVAPPGDARS